MRTATSALATLLASRIPMWSADLFDITLADGSVYYWTTTDIPIAFNGVTYLPTGPRLERSRWNMTNTMVVPELAIQVLAGDDSSFNVNGVNFKQLAQSKGLDGALIQLQRVFGDASVNWGSIATGLGSVVLFKGRTGAITINALEMQITVKGVNVIFNRIIPRNLYQIQCLHTVYDTGCQLLKTSFVYAGTVDAGPTVTYVPWVASADDPINCALGTIKFNSGVLNGLSGTIKYASSAGIVVAYPFPEAPAPGDTFLAYFGCDRMQATCSGKFANLAQFLGMPYVPDISTSY